MVTSRDIEAMIPPIWVLVRREFPITSAHSSPEDLVQVALEAICKAAPRFDARKANFETFSTHRARGAIRDYLRAQRAGTRRRPQPEPRSFDEPHVDAKGDLVSLEDLLTVEDRAPDDHVMCARLYREIDRLPEATARIFRLYAEADLSLREIAVLEGVTQSRVSQRLRLAREVLRPVVEELAA